MANENAPRLVLITLPTNLVGEDRQQVLRLIREAAASDIGKLVLPIGSVVNVLGPNDRVLVDTTDTGDGGFETAAEAKSAEAVLRTAEVLPERVTLQVGALEVLTEEDGEPGPVAGHRTRVLVDGKPFPVRSIHLDAHVHGVWRVRLDFFPESVKQSQEEQQKELAGHEVL